MAPCGGEDVLDAGIGWSDHIDHLLSVDLDGAAGEKQNPNLGEQAYTHQLAYSSLLLFLIAALCELGAGLGRS